MSLSGDTWHRHVANNLTYMSKPVIGLSSLNQRPLRSVDQILLGPNQTEQPFLMDPKKKFGSGLTWRSGMSAQQA